MTWPSVTIVVTARDRFDYSIPSLESIYQHTTVPFDLVYVAGKFPPSVRAELERLSKSKPFTLIQKDHYLMPQSARNIGARLATGKYVVFIENDCVVTPGWLESLLTCAEETGAAAVSPIVCEGTPLHTILHFVGGEVSIRVEKEGGVEKRHLIDKINHQGLKVVDIRPGLKRSETGAFEFHCVLMRRDAVEKAGYFDEGILSKELVDFTLMLKKAGEKIYLEPAALVSFMSEPPLGPPLHKDDIPFYELRWADDLEIASLHRLRDKWQLTEDTFFPNRYQSPYLMCQGILGITRAYPAGDNITAACTINAESAAVNVPA